MNVPVSWSVRVAYGSIQALKVNVELCPSGPLISLRDPATLSSGLLFLKEATLTFLAGIATTYHCLLIIKCLILWLVLNLHFDIGMLEKQRCGWKQWHSCQNNGECCCLACVPCDIFSTFSTNSFSASDVLCENASIIHAFKCLRG